MRQVRFIEDAYFELTPDFKRSCNLCGKLPGYQNPRGIIVNELAETIELPFMNLKFTGELLAEDFEAISTLIPTIQSCSQDFPIVTYFTILLRMMR